MLCVKKKKIVDNKRKIMCFLNIKACQHILVHQIHKIMIFKIASYDPFKIIFFCGYKIRSKPTTAFKIT